MSKKHYRIGRAMPHLLAAKPLLGKIEADIVDYAYDFGQRTGVAMMSARQAHRLCLALSEVLPEEALEQGWFEDLLDVAERCGTY